MVAAHTVSCVSTVLLKQSSLIFPLFTVYYTLPPVLDIVSPLTFAMIKKKIHLLQVKKQGEFYNTARTVYNRSN